MEDIYSEIIKVATERVPNRKIRPFLSDLLCLNNEAIYRRLKGQVPFTLEEAIKICRELNISLDLIAGIKSDNNFAFHLDTFVMEENLFDGYRDMLIRIIETVNRLKDDPTAIFYVAYRTIPDCFLYKYEKLSRVYVYNLYYQLHSNKMNAKKMGELVLPKDIHAIQKNSVSNVHDVESLLIFDKDIIIDYINIIKYFSELGLITEEEIIAIKEELYLLISDIERCADTGTSMNGKKMNIYLSNISFDCNYNCMESKSFCVSSLGVYAIDYLSCENKTVFGIHKSWILSLLKFSVLISVADELTRRSFFEQQKKYIEEML